MARKLVWETRLGKPAPMQKKIAKTLYLHKEQKMKTGPLDVAPERRTQRCSPRFRPGGRFWNQGSNTPGSIAVLSLLVLYSAMRGFPPVTPIFPSHQKPAFDLI